MKRRIVCLMVFILSVILSAKVMANDVTLRVVDQYGTNIENSTIVVEGVGTYVSDGEASLEPSTYLCHISPAINKGTIAGFELERSETITISETTTEVEFEWIMVATTAYVNDQYGNVIPGAGFYVTGLYGGYAWVPSGTTVYLPTTLESIYPSMSGNWVNGIPFSIHPAINGVMLHIYELFRRDEEYVEIYEGMAPINFEWIMVPTTAYVRDQHGDTIPGAGFDARGLYGGYAWLPSGTTVHLPITDETVYPTMEGWCVNGLPFWVRPAINGTMLHQYELGRGDTIEIYEGMAPINFEWIMVPTTAYVVDQHGDTIPGAGFDVTGMYGGYAWLPSGTTVDLPITDETVYPTMEGWNISGLRFNIRPAINGKMLHPYSLVREDTVEIYQGMEPIEFDWIQIECPISLVGANDLEIADSFIRLIHIYHYLDAFNGETVRLPTTDELVYPKMSGALKDGYPIELFPGGVSVGTGTFEVTGALVFDPPFVTLNGTQYGLRCRPQAGSVAGRVVADCPSANTGLLGVEVDAFKLGTGELVVSVVTDVNGNYQIDSLPVGNYTITIVTPLGYTASQEEAVVTIAGGEIVNVDFSLSCIKIISNPRTIGFWKHQFGVVLGGKGKSQIDATALCNYLDLIEVHFNHNQINPVIVYQPPASALCNDKLGVARSLLNLEGSVEMVARAKQQLMALLLNVTAGYISQTEVISFDGVTVSQIITYCDNLIDDGDPSNDEIAKTIADYVNNNIKVPAGTIPLSTPNIAYRVTDNSTPKSFTLSQNHPNPFNSNTTVAFTVSGSSFMVDGPIHTTLKIYNIRGQLVRTLVDEGRMPGNYNVNWDGKDDSSKEVGSGIYFYQLKIKDFTITKKMALLR